MKCYSFSRAEPLVSLMKFVSFWGNGVVIPILLVLIAALIFYIKKEKAWTIAIIIATFAGEVIKEVLKNLFKYQRPALSGCFDISGQDGLAFPSGHTTFYVIFFGLIAYYLIVKTKSKIAKLSSIFPIIMVLSVGYSRVYLGAHWVRDVVAGYALGFIILIITILVLKNSETKS